jgi:nickel transport protein
VKLMSFGLIVGLALAASTPVYAHGIWYAQHSGETALIYGHAAEDLDMVKRFDKIREVAAYDTSGAPVKAELKKTDHLVLVTTPAKPAVLTAILDNGYWSKNPEGKWINKGYDEVPNAKESGRYVKYTVHLVTAPTAPVPALPGQVLQIVPVLKQKFPHHMGETMTVRVLFNGKPVAGAKVVRDYMNDADAKPMVTGKNGEVTFKVRNQGMNVIAAHYDAAPDDPAKAKKNGLFASLSFALAHGPE